ncbi:MAG TPA: DEAD/DEAH box helicase family protein [Leptospiraceae bacterium]|nr:DEAD/DEAH box helicase family protein [Leptospiraceae bacterium]HNC58057.1 DEAD/DEAH box helicase family protein [Leptospiraceae bacterium]HNH02847.1 DEAD/DEAH box helicase family protein [Leptospiraceae bacterium]HNH57561.1 DEAD/DEAH box helicase family protein [Leptospiraceae bacterium]HNI91078.1 DEAD/DEAH box helicase family protein [Leptospiraceae bacterium]
MTNNQSLFKQENITLDKVAKKSDLEVLLYNFRTVAVSEREKGTYFEELIRTYLKNEPKYKDLYEEVWHYGDWAKQEGMDARDTGIDLVARANGTNEYYAIQCKFYDPDYRVQKSDIDSFFTASGKKPFSHRVIVTTTNNWSEHAEDALLNQTPPVTKIDLYALENSQIDWSKYKSKTKPVFKPKKKLRPHQEIAVKSVLEGLKKEERGKLIMACGTGKTFTSLKIAEKLAGKGKRVLFLVPSLALLSQSLTEWTQESEVPLHSFAVCSDSEVGKKRNKEDDVVNTFAHELQFPATTEPSKLAKEMKSRHDAHHMSVVFSTYHSIDVIGEAQKKYKLEDFDLIVCDEAHRTTGATFGDEDESKFVKVHDGKFIRANKRLYMTATPRIYGEAAKVTAEKENVALCSMDDEKLYGKQLHVITFSQAVQSDLLVDYKVIVLAVDEAHISSRLQKLLADEDNQIKVDDAAKIIGCWKALSKQGAEDLEEDNPMRRAVAFCQVIEYNQNSKTHKVSSKQIAKMFQAVVDSYISSERSRPVSNNTNETINLKCQVEHVDGSMNATEKESKIHWLKRDSEENVCKILSNVRCLSEGVDVPALDAVLFLTPRNSQVDVVQSVGRVMRKAEGKSKGYVILPVVIPAGIPAHEALNDNKTYKVVWQVLQALRSHDDRFDAMINKMELIGPDKSKMEVIAVTDSIAKKTKSGGKSGESGNGNTIGKTGGSRPTPTKTDTQQKLQFDIGEIEIALYAKVVQKCGNRHHWEDWANDIAKIANTHITRIRTIVENKNNTKERKAFYDFADELRDDLNESITNEEVIEMLAQHLITKPVFDALFSKYEFTKQNSVSRAMDEILSILEKHHIEKEADTLKSFYASVRMRAEGIENAQGRQKIILELYDKFFRNAFPKLTERLGIVYTPVEVVDFIIHSVNDILRSEFGESLGSKNVQILDPFTGTGTFITRLMQSGLLTKEELIQKYKTGLHANEIVLLAYYIAAINIESTYHDLVNTDYTPFTGILLTDSFQLFEKDDLISRMLVDNSERRVRQKKSEIKVVICNPPYSAGQTSANDNNQNVKYPILDARITETYAKESNAALQKNLYDSYIRAIRWASDRIGESGILGMVTNASYIDGNAMDGLRKCLQEEYTSLYIFHLRGNARTSGELRRKEKDNVFGQGTRTPIAISIFVKNAKAKKQGEIYFHDIGDYLTQQEKLGKISTFKSINGISQQKAWVKIHPDKYNDWINQRDDSFYEFISIGDKKDKSSVVLFENFSLGLATNRDSWVYNFSKKELTENINRMITFYNSEVDRYKKACKGKKEGDFPATDRFINSDSKKISWTVNLKKSLEKNKILNLYNESFTHGMYRPFTKQNLYFNRDLIERVLQIPKIFPTPESENLVICVTGIGSTKEFSTMISNIIPDLEIISKSQCFPLYLYDTDAEDKEDLAEEGLFKSPVGTNGRSSLRRRHAITDAGLAHFQTAYPKEKITKEDIFYYIYGLLHSPEYKTKYADNLSKELPRIPCVKRVEDFRAFTKAGRELAKIHVDYEKAELYPVTINESVKIVGTHGGASTTTTKSKYEKIFEAEKYFVTQMKYMKSTDTADVGNAYMRSLQYNDFITITDIPEEAYEYIVNGKPALDWIVERYCVKTDKDSGITNDANLWGIETEKNPKYPLELFQRIITVSLETMKIVKTLPRLEV